MEHVAALNRSITVVIPALNEGTHIERCLESLAAQTMRPGTILLVDGGSTDETVGVAIRVAERLHLPLQVMHNPERRVPHALNLALDRCETPYLVRVDAHARINDRYLETLVEHLDAGHDGAGGRKSAVSETRQGEANALALSSRVGVGGSAYHYATVPHRTRHIPYGAYRVERLRELGGWNVNLPVNQDFELDHRLVRAGGTLILDPAAEISWACRSTLRGHFAQYRRYGSGKAAVLRLHPGSARPRHLLPAAAVLMQTLGLVAATRRRSALLPSVAYLGLLGLEARRLTAGRAVPPSRVFGSMVAMHFGYGLGLLEGVLLQRTHASQLPASADAS
jgi:succinoglycan biosynthesis protein ExoA